MKTKYELIEELPSDGVAIFNYDNEHLKSWPTKPLRKITLWIGRYRKLRHICGRYRSIRIWFKFYLKGQEGKQCQMYNQAIRKA